MASVEHPAEVEFQTKAFGEEDDKLWYEVVASRVANVGKLTVRRLSQAVPESVEDSTQPIPATITVDNQTDLFIGGAPRDYFVSESTVFYFGCG